jgi:hypothetical protein
MLVWRFAEMAPLHFVEESSEETLTLIKGML